MRKVELRMNEQMKYETIKELVDHHGNKRHAALKLGLSIRQVNRLINVYKAKGKAGFVHGNRNRRPANSLPQELAKQIIALYRNDYQGFNFKHFTECVYSMIMSQVLERENVPGRYSLKLTVFIARLASF